MSAWMLFGVGKQVTVMGHRPGTSLRTMAINNAWGTPCLPCQLPIWNENGASCTPAPAPGNACCYGSRSMPQPATRSGCWRQSRTCAEYKQASFRLQRRPKAGQQRCKHMQPGRSQVRRGTGCRARECCTPMHPCALVHALLSARPGMQGSPSNLSYSAHSLRNHFLVPCGHARYVMGAWQQKCVSDLL